MHQRIDIDEVDPRARRAVMALQRYVNSSDLDKGLIALVEIRASQMNQCAWCLDMHVRDGREAGIEERKLHLVAAWREAPGFFSAQERAALAFTEQVTLISEGGVSDSVWAAMLENFSEEQTVQLLMTIATINTWNRLNVTVRTDLS